MDAENVYEHCDLCARILIICNLTIKHECNRIACKAGKSDNTSIGYLIIGRNFLSKLIKLKVS